MIFLIFQLGLSITTVLIMLLLAYLSMNVKDLYINLLLYQIYVYFHFEIYFSLLIILLNANFVFVIFLVWVFLYFIRSSMPSAIALTSTNIFRDRYSNLLFIIYFSFQLYIFMVIYFPELLNSLSFLFKKHIYCFFLKFWNIYIQKRWFSKPIRFNISYFCGLFCLTVFQINNRIYW